MVRAVSLEYGFLKNGNLEAILTTKIRAMEILRNSNGNLKFSLKNGNLKESDAKLACTVGNFFLVTQNRLSQKWESRSHFNHKNQSNGNFEK